jgi:hypothetical protein
MTQTNITASTCHELDEYGAEIAVLTPVNMMTVVAHGSIIGVARHPCGTPSGSVHIRVKTYQDQ